MHLFKHFHGGGGTSNNPYLISTPDDLVQLSTNVNNGTNYKNKFFKLANDIDMSSVVNFTPIGYNLTSTYVGNDGIAVDVSAQYYTGFSGTFDGAGHTISNLTIDYTVSLDYSHTYRNKPCVVDGVGLFGRLDGTVKNLTIDKANIKLRIPAGEEYDYVNSYGTSALVGRLGYTTSFYYFYYRRTYGTVDNCTIKNSVIRAFKNDSENSSSTNVGAVVGDMIQEGTSVYHGNITNCTSENNTIMGTSHVGGISGIGNPNTLEANGNTSFGNTVIATNGNQTAGSVSGDHPDDNAGGTNNTTSNGENTEREVYLYTDTWNFIGRIGSQIRDLNKNIPTSVLDDPVINDQSTPWNYDITANGYYLQQNSGHCDIAALAFDYTDSGNDWTDTNYLIGDNAMVAGDGYFVWPMHWNYAQQQLTHANGFIPTIIHMQESDWITGQSVSINKTNAANVSSMSDKTLWFALGNPYGETLTVADLVGTKDDIGHIHCGSIYCTTDGGVQLPIQGQTAYVYDSKTQSWEAVGKILPGQGFMVAAASDGWYYHFSGDNSWIYNENEPSENDLYSQYTDIRKIAGSMNKPVSNKSFKSDNIEQNKGIELKCYANGTVKRAYAKQEEYADDGFDLTDVFVLLNGNDSLVEPYFLVGDKKVMNNNYKSDNYSCPINFNANVASEATLVAKNIPEGTTVSIINIQTNEQTVLNNSAHFVFNVLEGDNSGKYVLKIVKSGVDINDVAQTEDNIKIMNFKNTLTISGKDLRSVTVYDALGQQVYFDKTSGNEYKCDLNINSGVYVVKVISTNGSKSDKIIVTK